MENAGYCSSKMVIVYSCLSVKKNNWTFALDPYELFGKVEGAWDLTPRSEDITTSTGEVLSIDARGYVPGRSTPKDGQ